MFSLFKIFNKPQKDKKPQEEILEYNNFNKIYSLVKKTKRNHPQEWEFFCDFLENPNHIPRDKENNPIPEEQGKRFENFIYALYTLAGYSANINTKQKGSDQGVDVIVNYKNNKTLLIQCKNYSLESKATHLVGVNDIRNLNGTELTGKKILITTSYDTNNEEDIEKYKDVTIIDRNGLYTLIMQLVPELFSYFLVQQQITEQGMKICKNKDDIMIKTYNKKTGKHYLRCRKYKNGCNYTEKIPSNDFLHIQ